MESTMKYSLGILRIWVLRPTVIDAVWKARRRRRQRRAILQGWVLGATPGFSHANYNCAAMQFAVTSYTSTRGAVGSTELPHRLLGPGAAGS